MLLYGKKMKILPLTLFTLIMPFSVFAGEWEFDASGSTKALYGYTDVSKRFEKQNDNNHGIGYGEINLSANYISDSEKYSLGIYADIMGGIDRELKDYNQGSWGEEVYGILDTPYGQLMLGQTFNVASQFHQGAPAIGALKSGNDVVDFIVNPNWKRNSHQTKFATLNATYINTDGVAPKISYITPEVYGTAVGFSFVPDSYNRRGLINKHAPYANQEGYIASLYSTQEFYGFNVSASLGFARFQNIDNEFSASLLFEYGNWSLGGGWRKTYIDGEDRKHSSSHYLPYMFDTYREGYAWDIGAGYKFGPYQASLSYFESKSEHYSNQDKIWIFSNQYQVNRYVDLYFAVAHVDFEGYNSDVDNNNQGWAFVTGFGLNF